jgi:flagella basal body P-ring formation protein FlgA
VKLLLYIALFILMLIPAFAYAGTAEEFVKDELSSMLPWEAGAIEVDEVEIPGLQAGKGVSLKLDMPKRPTGPGKVSFKVEAREKGMAPRVFWGSARVRVFKDAIVALRPMKAKTKINVDDVKTARVELNEASSSFATVDEIEGMVAKRPITAGSVIKKEYVRPETIVKRGEKVALMIEGPSIRIRSHGVASEDGHMGGTIAVRTASGKEVPGQVTGPGEIVIGF